jgi:hypothetical protein
LCYIQLDPLEYPVSAGEKPVQTHTSPEPYSEDPNSGHSLSQVLRNNRLFFQGKVAPAFWNVASLVSIIVNAILIAVIILLARDLFAIKHLVSDQLIGGLYQNFVAMDNSHIVTNIQVHDTIQVNDKIPVVFDLPLKQDTQVKLTKDTPVRNATIFLNGQAVPLDIVLRKGTALNISLDLTVPVSQTVPVVLNVPVNLNVPVDIALDQTDLHQPFVGLQEVVAPYHSLLSSLPDTWRETPLCGALTNWFCDWFLASK